MKFRQRVTQIAVVQEGETIFSETATTVTIVDEAAGEFVEVRQVQDYAKPGLIAIGPEEWPALRQAIDTLIGACEKVQP